MLNLSAFPVCLSCPSSMSPRQTRETSGSTHSPLGPGLQKRHVIECNRPKQDRSPTQVQGLSSYTEKDMGTGNRGRSNNQSTRWQKMSPPEDVGMASYKKMHSNLTCPFYPNRGDEWPDTWLGHPAAGSRRRLV